MENFKKGFYLKLYMRKKAVLITGSSRGLGEQLAYVFSENDWDVIIHGRNKANLEKIALSIRKNNPLSECEIVLGDISKSRTLDLLKNAGERYNINVLINNAGVYSNKPIEEMSENELRGVMEINFFSPALLIKKLWPFFKEMGSGLIVNINSIAAEQAGKGEHVYSASKAALKAFSTALRYDATSSGIRVLNVYSGAMNTEMVKGRKDPEKCIDPKEAARCIVGLCGDYPSLMVDGVHIGRRKY